jgi:hypothetical protein
MPLSLSPETERLIEARMKETGVESADDMIRLALRMFDQTFAEGFEDLDPQTRKSIDESEAEYQRGGGIPADEAFAMLRRKHFGDSGSK